MRLRDLASMFGCSTCTVERRLQHLNISLRSYSDEELDSLVSQVTRCNPKCGEKSVTGRLKSVGILVQQERVRESLRRVDPNGGMSRFATVFHRRVYAVHSPNALWHIDGYHKLIRWKIVIHGGIEPISRHQPTTVQLPFYLHSRMLYKSMVSLMSENGCRWGECFGISLHD